MDLRLIEYLQDTKTNLSENCWRTFGRDICKLKFTKEEWKTNIERMEQFCRKPWRHK